MWLNNHTGDLHYYENIVLKVVLLKKLFSNRASNWLAAGSASNQSAAMLETLLQRSRK